MNEIIRLTVQIAIMTIQVFAWVVFLIDVEKARIQTQPFPQIQDPPRLGRIHEL